MVTIILTYLWLRLNARLPDQVFDRHEPDLPICFCYHDVADSVFRHGAVDLIYRRLDVDGDQW